MCLSFTDFLKIIIYGDFTKKGLHPLHPLKDVSVERGGNNERKNITDNAYQS